MTVLITGGKGRVVSGFKTTISWHVFLISYFQSIPAAVLKMNTLHFHNIPIRSCKHFAHIRNTFKIQMITPRRYVSPCVVQVTDKRLNLDGNVLILYFCMENLKYLLWTKSTCFAKHVHSVIRLESINNQRVYKTFVAFKQNFWKWNPSIEHCLKIVDYPLPLQVTW